MGNIFPVRQSKVHKLLKCLQAYMWYDDDISLTEHRLVGSFQFGKTVRNNLKP